MRLYEIESARRALLDHVAENEGEITDEDEADLDRLFGDASEKWQRCGDYRAELVATEHAIGREIDRLLGRQRVVRNKREGLDKYLWTCLQLSGQRSVDVGTHRFSLRKGRTSVVGAQEALEAGQLPDDYVRTTVRTSPDKKAIGDALKQGREVPGCSLVVGPDTLAVK